MTLKELKSRVENKTVDNSLIIFRGTDCNFLAHQYINAISSILNKPVEYISSLDPFMVQPIFEEDSEVLSVYSCDALYNLPVIKNNLIIITKDCADSEYVIPLDKLEVWQIKDYLYSLCDGCKDSDLEYLYNACGGDINRIHVEAKKINIFEKSKRKYIIKEFYQDHQLPRDNVETIFDFTKALLNKDIATLNTIYTNIANLDIEPLGVVTIIYKNLKNMILVGFQNNPTSFNTGLSDKQIWGVQQSLKTQTASRILKMFDVVTDIDFKLKNGEFPQDLILDYTVMKCLAVN